MCRLLLVEDNELNRDALARRLARRGYDVLLAEDGAQGLAVAAAEKPALIVLDLGLPGMSGWNMAHSAKRDPRLAAVPIIGLTPHTVAGDTARAIDADCDDYEPKPIDLVRLLKKIERLLGDTRPRRSDKHGARVDADHGGLDQMAMLPTRATVLVADDHADSRRILSQLLEHRGFEVRAAADGLAALDILERERVDIVLLDVKMPRLSGLEVLARIRETQSVADLPVIMITACDQSDDIVEALTDGANDYLTKPIDFPVVLARIRTQLAARRADPLTGLANRLLFLERANHLLEQVGATSFAVLLLDLDRFTLINDSLGPTVGDQLLTGVARRLETALRSSDTIARLAPGPSLARLGGDEFAVVLDRVRDIEHVQQVATRLLASLHGPFRVDKADIFMTASVGIVVGDSRYPRAEDVLRDAEIAVHNAKQQGRSSIRVFDLDMHAAAEERLRLESDLPRALERGEMFLAYQPIMSLKATVVEGVEALVRWDHPHLGLLPPARFMSVAEESGFAVPLGTWVLREACRQMMVWSETYPAAAELTLHVNLSVPLCHQSSLPDIVRDALRDSGLAPQRLRLEIVETTFLNETPWVLATMRALRLLGVQLVLDDFGTGYSALGYLQRFRFDMLKLDRTFVQRLTQDGAAEQVVHAVVELASTLQMSVIAEGVETPEQLERVRHLRCQAVQGHFFSAALDAVSAEAWLVLHGGLHVAV